MRTRYLAVAVGVAALVGTNAFAERGGGRSEGRSSGHASARSSSSRGSSASSRSGRSGEYRAAAPRYSSDRGATSRYRTDRGRSYSGYRNYRYAPYRYRSYSGYRSYYRPGFSLYLGSPWYYDSYYYGGYYPQTYTYAPYVSDYGYSAPVPVPANDGYGVRSEDADDDRGQPESRDFDRAPAPEARDSGRLRLDVRPADATIYVDDQFRGTAGDATVLTLARGRHTVEVARPGFESQRRVVEVGSGDPGSVQITLQPARR